MRKCEAGSLVQADDGLPARCVGPWSREKLVYIKGYLDLFSKAMHRTFRQRHYVDLFSGPGRCVVDDGSGEIDGSPLVALCVQHQFTGYHFVEADQTALSALRERAERRGSREASLIRYYSGDANCMVGSIAKSLPPHALNVVVVDPTGLQLRFESLRTLAGGKRKVDLLYVFTEGMSIKRNREKFLRQERSRLDDVVGDKGWRTFKGPIVAYFRNKLAELGYITYLTSPVQGEIQIRNRKGVSLYYLLYATKNPLGQRLWNAMRQARAGGQMELRFKSSR